jgi:hypothetical protein
VSIGERGCRSGLCHDLTVQKSPVLRSTRSAPRPAAIHSVIAAAVRVTCSRHPPDERRHTLGQEDFLGAVAKVLKGCCQQV